MARKSARRAEAAELAAGQLAFGEMLAASKTAPCVPAIRQAVTRWRAGGYEGATRTSRDLLNHWFQADHRLPNGRSFRYHYFQREAVETLIYLWEVDGVRTRTDLLERYASTANLRLPKYDLFARYAVKMATGSGKTKVMSLAVAWQYLNAALSEGPDYSKTFLLIAPNVIVFERLRTDFEGGRIFSVDPVIPKHMRVFWDFDCVIRGEGERAPADGVLFLTNVQQLYEPTERPSEEPDELTAVLGPKPIPNSSTGGRRFAERIAEREGTLLVVNDEAHHTHDEESEWNRIIRGLNEKGSVCAQFDFSATPRYQKGALFPWTVYDYPLKLAIYDNVVKRPVKGVASIEEAKSDIPSIRYQGFLVAGVNRWREYREQLADLGKKPILFVMMNSTKEADEVGDSLRTKYPSELGGEKTLIIHTDNKGEVSKKDLDAAREVARRVDDADAPVNAIVSVLMLREGWDVQNVTVIVGLRPYTAKANILPEQTVGRGLRLMLRGGADGYTERVDVIGNKKFIEFVEDLEKVEDIELETFDPKKDKLKILAIAPQEDKAAYDIGLPRLSPALMRKRTLAEEIDAIDVSRFSTPPLPVKPGDKEEQSFEYEGYDILTLEKLVEREYTIPEPQTPGEVVGYYARVIASDLKLPSQFAYLAPKIKEFFEEKAFGRRVDLEDKTVLKAMSRNAAAYVVRSAFGKALKDLLIQGAEPELLVPDRPLSECEPFPWSRPTYEARKTVFNLVPCDNQFEREFARFLDQVPDVEAFAKLPEQFGFSIEYTDNAANLRYYYPDFAARLENGERWLVETKGAETVEVAHKDRAAALWCENATALTGTTWRYLKVPQKEFTKLQPSEFADLEVLHL
jgi:type III restriction enzyme